MDYQTARSLFKNGDLVFFSRGHWNIVRRLIVFFSKGKYYHVGVAFWAKIGDENRLMLIESQPGGLRIINMGFLEDRDMTVFRCPVDWDIISSEMLDSTGRISYDFVDVAMIGLHERFGVPISRKITGKGEVCSVYISKMLQKAGLTGIDTLVSPNKLCKQLEVFHPVAFEVVKNTLVPQIQKV